MAPAGCDGGEGVCGLAGWLGVWLVGAAAGHELGVCVVLASVRVEQCFLVGDELVARCEVLLGGVFGSCAGGDGCGVRALPGDRVDVDVEQAAVGVQEVFLVGD